MELLRESLEKRLFDFLLALFGLLTSLPLWVFISLAIWLEDGLPIFYSKEVLGKGDRRFFQSKFRTMVRDASTKVAVYTSPKEDSPYITKVGRTLRKTAMDELPQLVNILKADMSFVGPRPYAPSPQEDKDFHLRRAIRPGLTGMAQIFLPKLASDEEVLKMDLEYIKERDFLLDLKLIFLSFWITFREQWENPKKKI